MKKFHLSILLIMIVTASPAQKPMDKSGFQDLILRSFNDIFSEWKIDKIDEYYTSDFKILEDGLIWNKDSLYTLLKRRIESGKKIDRKNKIEVIDFDQDKKTAWGSYYNYAEIKTDDGKIRKVKWLESAVLVKQKPGWKIKLLHSTPIK